MEPKQYERDFFAWTEATAKLIRQGRLNEIDGDAVAEEIESLGRSDRREVVSRLIILIQHLLKCQLRPANPSKSWIATIREQRLAIELVLDDSPSLRAQMDSCIAKAYPQAAEKAAVEMKVKTNPFPQVCPFTPDQILGQELL